MLVLLDRDWAGVVKADPQTKIFSHQCGVIFNQWGEVKPPQPSRQIERKDIMFKISNKKQMVLIKNSYKIIQSVNQNVLREFTISAKPTRHLCT